MSSNKPAPGAGDVPIELDGDSVVLKPSLDAAMQASRLANGLTGAIDRCARYDLDTIIRVVALGLGLTGNGSKDLPGKVYRTGVHIVAPACIRFLNILSNGGRPIGDGDDDEDKAPLEGSA
jgi:hypothetical protein